MAEQNDLNNDNSQPYNNKKQSIYRHLFLTGQPTQNQSNIEPLLPTDQLNVTPQINNDNYYQINTQNNNLKSLNNSHFINARLNNGTMSHKRKKLQILLIYLLYIMGIMEFLLYFLRNISSFGKSYSFLIALIISMLNIILASTIVFNTKKKQKSRTITTTIFSFILCAISVKIEISEINSKYKKALIYLKLGNLIEYMLISLDIGIGILIIIFYFVVFLFNFNYECLKVCD